MDFQPYPQGRRDSGWGTSAPGSCKGGQHCVDRGSTLGKLYFGKGTQLTVRPGEWVVLTLGKHHYEETEREMNEFP